MAIKNPIVLIPARLASVRLPNKPLAPIGGVAMIVRVMRLAVEADIGRVVVATGDAEIASVVREAGGEAILTDPDLPSGSDRIYQALTQIETPNAYDAIVNLQGDLPYFDSAILARLLAILPMADITTPVVALTDEAMRNDPNVVKAVLAGIPQPHARALYFSRACVPMGSDVLYEHIGIYAYRRAALEQFIHLPPAPIEQWEKLEQLRALAAGMHIEAVQVETRPLSVDTPQDLQAAQAALD